MIYAAMSFINWSRNGSILNAWKLMFQDAKDLKDSVYK